MLSGPSESVLTKDHAQQLIAALPEHFADLTLFSLSTELRSANAARITWPQINLERRFAWERGSTAGVDRRAAAHRRGPGGRARPASVIRIAQERTVACRESVRRKLSSAGECQPAGSASASASEVLFPHVVRGQSMSRDTTYAPRRSIL